MYKKLRCAGEKSLGYTKGKKTVNYRSWWNNEIKQKRKERKQANKQRRKLENELERTNQDVSKMRELEKAVNVYKKKKMEAQGKIREAMQIEEEEENERTSPKEE